MRSFSIITHFQRNHGGNWPVYDERSGFMNIEKLHPYDLIEMAGWSLGISAVDIILNVRFTGNSERLEELIELVEDAQTDEEREIYQDMVDEILAQEPEEGELEDREPVPLVHREGRPWVYVLNLPMYLN